MMLNKELREKLADLQHQQWSGWMEYLFSKCTPIVDAVGREKGELIIPKWAVDRWTRQLKTKYADLPKEEKESDRVEADRYEPIIAELLKAQRAADYEAVKKAIKEQKPPVLAEFSEAASWNLEVRERLDDALAAIEAIYEQEAK